ncbi:hypothetical protein RJ639_044558, partial [Escallonia herrerae]
AMVTRYPSISTRKLSKALKILSSDKTMVAMSDYDEFHKTVKRHILANENPREAVNFRNIFEPELFGLAMKQALGKDVENLYVDELGTTLSRAENFKVLVHDPLHGAIEVDWRDFFPYLKWIPNREFEKRLEQMHTRMMAVMNALIREQKKRIASGEEINCYLDYLLTEAKTLSHNEITMLLWEAIIETSDTTLVTTEWAMFELAKDQKRQVVNFPTPLETHLSPGFTGLKIYYTTWLSIQQGRLLLEIESVCGSGKITEENLCQLPYLSAVFHETLRYHSPVPIIPLLYAHEETQLGGNLIPAGTEIAINLYGCNMEKEVWENPEEWNPERFLSENNDPVDLYKTMAFGGGKRVCAGALQAMLISCVAIARLVQEFEWKLKDGEEDDADTLGFTGHKRHPMHAFLNSRK